MPWADTARHVGGLVGTEFVAVQLACQSQQRDDELHDFPFNIELLCRNNTTVSVKWRGVIDGVTRKKEISVREEV